MKLLSQLLLAALGVQIAIAEDECTKFNSFRTDLFHSGYYHENNCSDAVSPPLSVQCFKNEIHFINLHQQLIDLSGELNKAWPHQYREGYNGLVATSDIEGGELIAFIPNFLLMTYKKAGKASRIATALHKEFQQGTFTQRPDLLRMVLYILQEKKNPFSYHYDWFQTLNFDLSTHVTSIDQGDQHWYQGSQVRAQAIQTVNGLTNEYNKFVNLSTGFGEKYSKNQFMETYTQVQAKTIDADVILPGYTQKIMAPFIDQINYSSSANVSWKFESREDGRIGIFVEATKAIKKGEELFVMYDAQNNRMLLQNYGFVDPDNQTPPHILAALTVKGDDPLKPYKDFWFKQGDPTFGNNIVIMPDGNFDSALSKDALAILRVAFFNDGQHFNYLMDANISWDKPRKNQFGPYSLAIEASIMRWLQTVCMNRLKEYPRTLAGDQEILKSGIYKGKPLSQSAKNGLILTADEKTSLTKIIEGTELVLELLARSDRAGAIKVIKENKKLPSHMTDYLNKDILPLLEKEINQK